MQDLTLLFITSNKMPEKWTEFHKKTLLEAARDYPILTISRLPMDWGRNLLQTDTPSSKNFYKQILRGAKTATTPYVALCEDDALYTADHFVYRPALDAFAYNINRWSLYTWGEPTYSFRAGDMCGCAGIYPRELVIEALEERFAKYPDEIPIKVFGELGRYEKYLGVTERKVEQFYSSPPMIQVNHEFFSLTENNPETVARRQKKRMGWLRATDIPYWGRASDIVKYFYESR